MRSQYKASGKTERKVTVATLWVDDHDDPSSCVTVFGPGGFEVQCSRSRLRRSSPVLDSILGAGVSTFHIRQGEPLAVRQMLEFVHGGKVELEVGSLPQLVALAKRYQVESLLDACKSCVESTRETAIVEICTTPTSSDSPDGAGGCLLTSPTTTDDAGGSGPDIKEQLTFMPLHFSSVKAIVSSSLPKLFLLDSFTEAYVNLAKLVIAWLEHDIENRSKHIVDVLGQLEFEYLGLDGITSMMECPQIANKAPQLMSRASQAISLFGQWPATFRTMGESQWVAPESGNYFIVCRGGSGDSCWRGGTEGHGGKGVMLGGTFYLEKGARLEIRIPERPGVNCRGVNRGGDGCCIGYRCQKLLHTVRGANRSNDSSKPQFHVLMVAGGGGGASSGGWGVIDGEDAHFSVASHGGKLLLKNRCGCLLRGMAVPVAQVDSIVLQSARGTMGRPYHSVSGFAGQSYLSSDGKGVYSQTGNSGGPSVSIYARPSYL
ncbi:hypothetical protein BSKO_09811 [Bryopsis sp. KO-2023]|nr:hypothetical protein BSKO_09811 [Bryopsis sp. KO-2023]